MKVFALIIICALLPFICTGQKSFKYPYYKNSAGLELGTFVPYLSEVISNLKEKKSFSNNIIRNSGLAFEFDSRIKNKFYFEAGFIPYWSGSPNHKSWGVKVFAGGKLKFKLFKNAYFNPSFNGFLKYSSGVEINRAPDKLLYIGAGPSIGFEYFLSKRISLTANLFGIAYGFPVYQSNKISSIRKFGSFDVYRFLGIGIHYNFN
ncbi:MAG: hypothetical protein H0W62_13275 [Chitinophagales bacterium]|nr:hypothetical protein [Chitinophagales bacterium]